MVFLMPFFGLMIYSFLYIFISPFINIYKYESEKKSGYWRIGYRARPSW